MGLKPGKGSRDQLRTPCRAEAALHCGPFRETLSPGGGEGGERVVVGRAVHLSVSLRFALRSCLLFEIDAVDNKKTNV